MIGPKLKKAGINRPIICSKCRHKIGYLKIKTRLRMKVWAWIFVLATITQIISEIIGRLVLGD